MKRLIYIFYLFNFQNNLLRISRYFSQRILGKIQNTLWLLRYLLHFKWSFYLCCIDLYADISICSM